jgi:hypothetical protein
MGESDFVGVKDASIEVLGFLVNPGFIVAYLYRGGRRDHTSPLFMPIKRQVPKLFTIYCLVGVGVNLVEKTWGFGLDYDHAGPLFTLTQQQGDEISTIYCWGVVRGSLSPSGLHWLSCVFLFWRVCCLFFVFQGITPRSLRRPRTLC